MEIVLVAARAANGVIGQGGALPFHLPPDLAHFKAITQGKPVIMGRKTWESLPTKVRPLPGRTNIVITRQPAYVAQGATVVPSWSAALVAAGTDPEVCIIGGAEIYALAMPHATRLELTELHQAVAGDTFFPPIPPIWQVSMRETHDYQGQRFDFTTYLRA
jgi:dihydrofolate reductase